jgi:ABC-type transport system involved in multi-copper enzyme maturation permease subunit
MNTAWHIARKDLRLHAWLLLVWIVIIALNVTNRLIGPHLPDYAPWRYSVLPNWLWGFSLAYVVMQFVCTALVIQADRLVGTTAFWLTRPISRNAMLCGKLLGLFLLLIAPALAGEAILMIGFHVSAASIAAASLQQTWAMSVGLLLFVLGATVTASLPRLLLLVAAVFTLLYVWFSVDALYQTVPPFRWAVPERSLDLSLAIIVTTMFALGTLAAIWFQYRQRRPVVALVIFCASVTLNWLTAGLWHVSLFGAPTVAHEAWSSAPLRLGTSTGAAITAGTLRETAWLVGNANAGNKLLMAPLAIADLPADYVANPWTVSARVSFADGSSVQSEHSYGFIRHLPIGPRGFWRKERWATLMNVSDEDLQKAGNRSGHYVGEFVIDIERHETLATMPLAPGAGYRDGGRTLFVSALHTRNKHCGASLRIATVVLLTDRLSTPALVPRFRLRDGTLLLDALVEKEMADDSPAPPHLASLYDIIVLGKLLHPFDFELRDAYVAYPASPSLASGPRCDEITIEFERVTYAGRLTRSLDVPDVRLNDAYTRAGFGQY